jgi:hypothetical protein
VAWAFLSLPVPCIPPPLFFLSPSLSPVTHDLWQVSATCSRTSASLRGLPIMAVPLKAPDPIPALLCSLRFFLSFLDFHFHFPSHPYRGRKASRGQEHWSWLLRQMNVWDILLSIRKEEKLKVANASYVLGARCVWFWP